MYSNNISYLIKRYNTPIKKKKKKNHKIKYHKILYTNKIKNLMYTIKFLFFHLLPLCGGYPSLRACGTYLRANTAHV